MSKQRFQITLNENLVKQARAVMSKRNFDSLSEFLESLIRDEAERRSIEASGQHDAPTQYPSLKKPEK